MNSDVQDANFPKSSDLPVGSITVMHLGTVVLVNFVLNASFSESSEWGRGVKEMLACV